MRTMMKIRPIIALMALVLLAGCPEKEKGKLVGWVQDTEGNRLPFVSVSVGDDRVYTDATGLYSVSEAKAGSTSLVAFSLEGYGAATRRVAIKGNETSTLNVTLKRLNAAKVMSDAAAGGVFTDNAGNSITLAPNTLASDGSKSVSGAVDVHVTAVNVASSQDLASFSGAFTLSASGSQVLEAYALANVTMAQNGAELELAVDATANLVLQLTPGVPVNAGDEVPLFHFNAASGLWIQAGTGIVVAGSGGTLTVSCTVEFFGWWCCGVTIPKPHTLQGHVYDAEGEAVTGAMIAAVGASYHGISFAWSNGDGAYSVAVKPDSSVQLQLVLPGAYYVCDTLAVKAGAAGETTKDQDLSPDFRSCVFGHVTQRDGTTPVKDVQVYSSAGGVATTGDDGSYCMAAPGSTPIAVYVLGRPPVVVETPAAATCEAGNGAKADITVCYPEDGDSLGFVVGNYSWNHYGSMALLYSGLKGDQFDGLAADTAMDTCTVRQLESHPAFDLSVYFGLLNRDLAVGLLFNLGYGVNEVFALEDDEVPSIEKIGSLDAGSPATLSNSATTISMKRPLDYYYDFDGAGSLQDLGYAVLESWMAGFYLQEGFASSAFSHGDHVTYSWPGGIDIGAFSGSIDIPGALTITSPTTPSNVFSADNLANGLTLTWDTSGQGDYVVILIETLMLSTATGTVEMGTVVCKASDDGSFTVPADVLAQLPHPAKTFTLQINYLLAKRYNRVSVQAPLARGNGNGDVTFIVGSEPVVQWGVDTHLSFPKDVQTTE